MSEFVSPFGFGAWVFIALYVGSLLLIGALSYRARQANTLKDFYLAGQGFGFFVLLLTLYATQYSGNSLFGFSGAAYRMGYPWLLSVHSLVAITVFFLGYAVLMHGLAKKHGFVTPADYMDFRFGSDLLSVVTSVLMILVLSNYLLAQLMAIGRALQGLAVTGGDTAYVWGVIVLAVIIVVYGTLGGLRAVAWTDLIQGLVLMVGFLLLLAALFEHFGPIGDATQVLLQRGESEKVLPPDASQLRQWVSYILLIGMGGALYPQAIQRIYAARTEHVLRRSLAVMAFMPFVTVLISLLTGIYALAYLPGLEGAGADQVLGSVFRVIQESSLLGYVLVVVIFAAVLAAIMSTADSAMLAISSMFTKDIYGRLIRPDSDQAHLAKIGKLCSWLLISLLVVLAIVLRDKASLISLIDRKFDILIQLVPAIMLGLRWDFLKARPVCLGVICGVAVSLVLAFVPLDFVQNGRIYDFHPGLFGLIINLSIASIGSLIKRKPPALHAGKAIG